MTVIEKTPGAASFYIFIASAYKKKEDLYKCNVVNIGFDVEWQNIDTVDIGVEKIGKAADMLRGSMDVVE